MAKKQLIEGFKTTEASRGNLISTLTIAMERLDLLLPKESVIAKELLSFVVNKNGKAEACKGANDDVLFALMLSLQAAGYRVTDD